MLRAYILLHCDAPRKFKLICSSRVISWEVCHGAQSSVKLAPIRKEEQVESRSHYYTGKLSSRGEEFRWMNSIVNNDYMLRPRQRNIAKAGSRGANSFAAAHRRASVLAVCTF